MRIRFIVLSIISALIFSVLFMSVLSIREHSFAMSESLPVSNTLTGKLSQVPGTGIRINEIMPKPDNGGFEWVELYRESISLVFLPIVINGQAVVDLTGQYPNNRTRSSQTSSLYVDISGWQVTD